MHNFLDDIVENDDTLLILGSSGGDGFGRDNQGLLRHGHHHRHQKRKRRIDDHEEGTKRVEGLGKLFDHIGGNGVGRRRRVANGAMDPSQQKMADAIANFKAKKIMTGCVGTTTVKSPSEKNSSKNMDMIDWKRSCKNCEGPVHPFLPNCRMIFTSARTILLLIIPLSGMSWTYSQIGTQMIRKCPRLCIKACVSLIGIMIKTKLSLTETLKFPL